jgi:hypothetical protein
VETPRPTPAPPKLTPVVDSTFQLTTSPTGSEAVFDGDQRCATPCSVTLKEGRHTFVVRHAGYREERRIIETPEDTGLIVDLKRATGTLTLLSEPAGLTVQVDGQEQSKKTPVSLILTVGQHQIRVTDGTRKQDFAVDVRDGVLVSRTVEFAQ